VANLPIDFKDYTLFLKGITETIRSKQLEAFRLVNKVLIELYWQIGQKIVEKQRRLDWGNAVIEMLADDLRNAFPHTRGLSVTNLKNMRKFYLAYSAEEDILALLLDIGWSHHLTIIEKVKNYLAREYYIRATRKYGWTVNVLIHKIESGDFERFAIAKDDNFDRTLPQHIRKQAKLAVKDHFIFDFLEMEEDHSERELENALVQHIHQFIIELGMGEFAFLGRQFRVPVGSEEFFIDLLFFHRSLQCLIAFDLKVGKFRPEFAGKMDFYLTALDRQVKKPHENPSIGIILCKGKDKTVVEYAFANKTQPMGAVTYTLKKNLPKQYRGLLPTPKMLKQQMFHWDQRLALKTETAEVVQETDSKPHKEDADLNPRQNRFLREVKAGDKLTSGEYAKKMKVSTSTALRDLKKMASKGFVKKVGQRKGSYFEVIMGGQK